jgi:hypothetical protein
MMDPNTIAQTVMGDIENCMSDLATGGGEEFASYEDQDAEADRLYNDPDTMGDLAGDRICWACNNMSTPEDKALAMKVARVMIIKGHTALSVAVTSILKRWEGAK